MGDLVSRTFMKSIGAKCLAYRDEKSGNLIAIMDIDLLPPAQPEGKGKWIHDGYDIPHGIDWMHCSVCGRREPNVPAARTPYCPSCGARMEEGETE